MNYKTLGISMIVKNESAGIRECLESIKDADEIVIVDTGSTDNTIEICREYTNKVYSYLGCMDEDGHMADFSDGRNKAKSYNQADYIIVLDADEQLITPISQIKRQINEYWFRKYFGMFFTIKMKYEIFESPRLFKNVPEIYYINPAHNVPTWMGDANDLVSRCYKSSFVIDSGYSKAHDNDPDRTFRILQKDYEKKPEDTRTLYYMAREYLNRKDVRKAIELFEKYKELKFRSCELWDNELADVFYLMALCYVDIETWGEAKWFDAVDCALWSFAILPTSKDTAEFLSRCFNEMPSKIKGTVGKQIRTVNFWNKVKEDVNDEGVLMKRKFNEEAMS